MRKYTQEQLELVIHLRMTTDYPSTKISELTGVSSARVKQLLRKLNISRPSGFQPGNPGFIGNHTEETKLKISRRHKATGHKPTLEAYAKGQPRSLDKRWGEHRRDPVKSFMYIYRYGAESRNHEFTLPRDLFERLIFQNCHYCGDAPTVRSVAKELELVCNGLDRVDNSRGYTEDNTVTACFKCNRMKFNFSLDEFVAHCAKIFSHCKDRVS